MRPFHHFPPVKLKDEKIAEVLMDSRCPEVSASTTFYATKVFKWRKALRPGWRENKNFWKDGRLSLSNDISISSRERRKVILPPGSLPSIISRNNMFSMNSWIWLFIHHDKHLRYERLRTRIFLISYCYRVCAAEMILAGNRWEVFHQTWRWWLLSHLSIDFRRDATNKPSPLKSAKGKRISRPKCSFPERKTFAFRLCEYEILLQKEIIFQFSAAVCECARCRKRFHL